MAKIVENKKGFKVLELSMIEFQSIGGLSICDGCNKAMFKGYWVAVLNYSFCEEDYLKWLDRAVNHDEDKNYETANFNKMKKLLKVQ